MQKKILHLRQQMEDEYEMSNEFFNINIPHSKEIESKNRQNFYPGDFYV